VDVLEVDITGLELGDSARVRDIKPVDGLEVLDNPSSPVVSIEIPRAVRSIEIPRAVRSAQADEAAAAAAEAEAAEAAAGEEGAGEEGAAAAEAKE